MWALKASDHVVMSNQYADSERDVNGRAAQRIRITIDGSAKFREVTTKEQAPEPVSEFLRTLITKWEADGRKLKDLAKAADLAKSMPSQIKARTSNASFYSASRLAKPFGYRDLPDLVQAAYKWWRSDRSTLPASAAETPLAEAMALAASYGVTPAQSARVLERFPIAEYAHKDELWWLAHFHEERSLDAERDRDLRALGHATEAAAKSRERSKSELREAHEAKRAAAKRKRAPARQAG
jgi:hypothetical protein